MSQAKNIKRYLMRGTFGLIALAVVLAVPIAINYTRYFWADKNLPDDRLTVSQTYAGNVAPEAFAGRVETLAQKHLADASLPGLTVAVSMGRELLFSAGYGYADIEQQSPVHPDTRFRIGSTAKALTGTLLGQLVDQKKVDLDQSIGTWVPALPDDLHALTLRQLASHTAGIRHYQITDFNLYTGNTWTVGNDGLDIFAEDALLFEPGTDFNYSTYGFTLLSRVLAEATGEDFLNLLQTELYAPANMSETSGDRQDHAIPNRAVFYATDDGKYTRAAPQDVSYKWAGGGIISTALDLVRFGNALQSGGLLSDETRTLIWTPVLLPGGEDNPQNYGLGWRRDVATRLFGEKNPTVMLHHGGIQIGGASFFVIIPDYGISVAVLTNTGSGEARGAVQDMAFDLVRLVVGE